MNDFEEMAPFYINIYITYQKDDMGLNYDSVFN